MSAWAERALALLGVGGRRPGVVEVPRLTGLRLETARQRCLEDGLLFAVEEPDLGSRSVVVAQTPGSNAEVEDYTTVLVRVAMTQARWHPRPWRWWVAKVLGSV